MFPAFLSELALKLGRTCKTRQIIRKPSRSRPPCLEALEDRDLLSTFIPIALVGENSWSQPLPPGSNSGTTTNTSLQSLGMTFGSASLAVQTTHEQISVSYGPGLGGETFNVMLIQLGLMENTSGPGGGGQGQGGGSPVNSGPISGGSQGNSSGGGQGNNSGGGGQGNNSSLLTVNAGGPYSGTADSPISLSATATNSSGQNITAATYTWSFGDGTTATGQTVNHTYTAAGSYQVKVTSTDAEGNQGSATTRAAVNPATSTQPDTDPYITTPYLSIPNFGAHPTIYSVKSGNWSDPTIWSLGRTPQAGDIVDINPGTTVTYNVNDSTDAIPLNTLEIQPTATLTFQTNINTQICVGNFLVLQGGSLVVGTAANPIAANVHANIDIANLPLNPTTDPNQFGDGLIGLGNVTMHGATMVPYATLSQEAHAGDTVLHFATPVTGWQVGQDILLPDTRQLPYMYQNYTYTSEIEDMVIQSISADGLTVTLTAPLKYDHLGAHDANGVLDYLPQVMNNNRNIMISSQSFTGTRGYTLFTDRANVDIEYAGFCELGRTNITDIVQNNIAGNGNLVYNTPGAPYYNSSMPANFADRTAMTMLDLIGPTTPQADGYQFTLIGNEVDNDGDGNANNPSNIQWGIVLNHSYYGLIQDNDVYSVAGAGIGVEDHASSYNRFDSNFVFNVSGTGNRTDQSFQGDAYWFGNPNNYITNNLATDINGSIKAFYGYGYDIDATYAGTVAIPLAQGDDPSVSGQSKSINMNDTPILAFTGNEVYGATACGMTLWWIGTFGDTYYTDAQQSVVKNFVAWNFSNLGAFIYPVNNLTIDGMVMRGDASQLSNGYNQVTGITCSDYMTHSLVIENSDIQGMGTGIVAPYLVGRTSSMDTTVIENSYLDNTVNIDISPVRSTNGTSGALSPQTLDINNVQFAHPSAASQSGWCDIAMSYVTSDATGTSDMSIPQYVYVTNYNDVSGDNFQVFYTQSPSPTGTVPSGATKMTYINGYVEPD